MTAQAKLSSFSVLSVNPGHDGAVVYLRGNELQFSVDAEKDNNIRHAGVGPATLLKAMFQLKEPPTVLALGGWSKGFDPAGSPVGGGYHGLRTLVEEKSLFGTPISYFSSTHERSHILCAYGLSPYPQGTPCYVLLWEGHLSALYYVDERVEIHKLCDLLSDPGIRYGFLYALADPTFSLPKGHVRLSDAGKLMAIAGCSDGGTPDGDGLQLIERLLDGNLCRFDLDKKGFQWSRYHNIGVEHRDFARVTRRFSEALFSRMRVQVEAHVSHRGPPLLIAGGCGLNCDWNSAWESSGTFSGVFVAPCPNDSGSALGTAVDALHHYTGHAKIRWSVYAGELAVRDVEQCDGFLRLAYDRKELAKRLAAGQIFGWVKGRYEMGPRALGARSILAAPYPASMLGRLNEIKKREQFRPIAPVCIEEDLSVYFDINTPSPYMLRFRHVHSDKIPAVTHHDRSARPQSVNERQNPELYKLLVEFRQRTETSVLCNTSLNFNGCGFINRLSDLHRFSRENGLDGFVFENDLFVRSDA